MNAKKCDRCGKFYVPYCDSNNSTKSFNAIELCNIDTFLNTTAGEHNGTRYYELCRACRDGLKKYLDSEI